MVRKATAKPARKRPIEYEVLLKDTTPAKGKTLVAAFEAVQKKKLSPSRIRRVVKRFNDGSIQSVDYRKLPSFRKMVYVNRFKRLSWK
jgi:DNA replication initiation complex subunit (GINS family)